jgi:hypothetical protein
MNADADTETNEKRIQSIPTVRIRNEKQWSIYRIVGKQCCGSALVSMRIRIQLFINMRIRIQEAKAIRIRIWILVRL